MRGTVGEAADHEGDDYIHADATVRQVEVVAATPGTVVYARRGCPQSTTLSPNTSKRECGAGWGNHVVVRHGSLYTRYAHLEAIAVAAGDEVKRGHVLGLMGNSGRSDVRHLHFELGGRATRFDPCGGPQSFDVVYEAGRLDF